ncbi:hypothetical protein WME89_49260 [Sorangium sp. So ce321]|uniref:hypothetical protein n=1 Tax=Sorangium sp. So ce321 TaxID=3133300 RepID=UPI003F5EBA08
MIDASDVIDASDASNANDANDASNASDANDASNASDASDASDSRPPGRAASAAARCPTRCLVGAWPRRRAREISGGAPAAAR